MLGSFQDFHRPFARYHIYSIWATPRSVLLNMLPGLRIRGALVSMKRKWNHVANNSSGSKTVGLQTPGRLRIAQTEM